MSAREDVVAVRWRDVASPAQVGMFRAVWVVGGAAIVASALLLIGAFTANTAAGESGQTAGLLGVVGLLFGAAIVIIGLLVRFGVMKSVSREPR
ncbi:hypothetical protein [Nocardia terpenica]|uniref:Uncharacterized protein n=1 Tax=Nocardia terpenica TaxID=455432 RepID=A0A6G9ZBB8_9NOCA|nr:hypothetical protein [Nocardia terpenica]QIS22446.1 hypothetical protein F6W96_33035 [Nocardia terpenica]